MLVRLRLGPVKSSHLKVLVQFYISELFSVKAVLIIS